MENKIDDNKKSNNINNQIENNNNANEIQINKEKEYISQINKINIIKEKQDINYLKSIIKEDECHNNEIKDDNISESSSLIKDDFLSSTSSLRITSNRLNSELDLDKIIAGRDEGSNINMNLNEILEFKIDEKLEEDENEDSQNLNASYYLGSLFRDVVIKKKTEKNKNNDLRLSIYKQDLNNINQNIDFVEIINAQLNEIKDNTLSYFNKIIKEFEKRYNDYTNKITNYMKENEIKISKVFQKYIENDENILEFAENNIFKQFDNILEIHENIFNSIEDHVGLLRAFLGTPYLIQQKNPLESFINNNSNDILNCWFLNKIDYQKLNLSNVILNKDLSELCSGYLCKKKNNNFSTITIKKDYKGNLSIESDFVRENINHLEKLKFKNLKSEEINTIFINKNNQNYIDNELEKKASAIKLKSLSIEGSDLSSTNLTKISAQELKKLKIKRTQMPFSLNYVFESIIGETLFLQKLYLQKCFIDDDSLSQIFLYLSEKQQIIETLQAISFLGNEITLVNMNSLIKNNCILKSLQYLDFSKNNIYDFLIDNFNILPILNVLDLTDNNISTYIFLENIKSSKQLNNIILLSNNIFINNNKTNASIYRKYLYDNLINFKYKIKKLIFSFLYDKESLNQLLELKISPMVKISLIKLDLSYCGLSNDNVYYFMKNNFGLLNLEELNLSNNFITIKIFNLLQKKDISIEKLYSLDLSKNNINSINIEEYIDIDKFIEKHSQLKKIKFQDSSFCKDLLLLFQNEKEKCEPINQKIINRDVKFIIERKFNTLISPLKELFELKDKEF